MKLIVLGVMLAFFFGVLSFNEDKLIIDTGKGKAVVNQGKELVLEKMKIVKLYLESRVEIKGTSK